MEKHHIFLWKIPVPLVEKPSITFCACAKIGVRAELHVSQLLFTLLCFFLKKVLSLCPYHWLLETLAFRPSVNSLS